MRRTGASSGLVSRIIQHLIGQGFVEKITAREFRFRDWLGLLDSWADSDRFPKRVRSTLYAGFFGSPQELADRLQKWAESQKARLAFTQWSAAWTRHPYTEPAVCSAYVDRPLGAVALDELGLRPVSDGGKLWLHTPDDEGLFTETQHRGGLTLVSDAQIYLDLQRTGLRGPDAASALREWEGFCRPWNTTTTLNWFQIFHLRRRRHHSNANCRGGGKIDGFVAVGDGNGPLLSNKRWIYSS